MTTKTLGSREAPFLFGDAVRSYLLRRTRGVTTGRVCAALATQYGAWDVNRMTSRVVDDYATARMAVVSGATAHGQEWPCRGPPGPVWQR